MVNIGPVVPHVIGMRVKIAIGYHLAIGGRDVGAPSSAVRHYVLCRARQDPASPLDQGELTHFVHRRQEPHAKAVIM